MTINEIRTLEDLRQFYEAEVARLDYENRLRESLSYLDSITDQFDLSEEQLFYVRKNVLSEEQSNEKTMELYLKVKAAANAILVKRRKIYG